jgi:hypothetical protein
MRVTAALLAVTAACGRVGFDPTADATGDVLAGDAAGACTDFAEIADNFDDATIAPKWTADADAGMSVDETGGILRISLVTTASDSYGALFSTCAYDARGRSVAITVAGRPRNVQGSEMALCFLYRDVGFEQVCVDLDGANVAAVYNDNDTVMTLASRTYNAITHRHWRVREQTGTTFFETSPDGTTWAMLHSFPSPFDMSRAHVSLLSGTYNSITNPGSADYDDVVIQ